MESTFEEGLLAEVQVDLTRNVELRMLETPPVVHILTSRGDLLCHLIAPRCFGISASFFTICLP